MRVAILGSAYPLRGGLASYNERLAIELNKQGHEVKIFTFSLQYPSVFFPGKTQYSDSPPPADLNIEVCLNSVNPLNWLFVAKKIGGFKPDLLIIKYWLPFMGPCLGTVAHLVRRGGAKVIAIVDNMIPHESRVFDEMFSKYFVSSSDAFIAMSDSVSEDICKFTSKPVSLHPHPLFDNFGESLSKIEACSLLGLNSQFDYLLFFGFIRDYKGLDLLMKAAGRLKGALDKMKILVAGEFYSNEEYYKLLEKKLGIEDRVIWHDKFIADEDVKAYFSIADLVVQPYKSATQSGVTQIAYHFEKPMIVTNVGGLPELVPHGKVGYVTEVNDASVAEAIVKFYSDTDIEKIRLNIRKQKLKFSWGSMCNTILELYKELS